MKFRTILIIVAVIAAFILLIRSCGTDDADINEAEPMAEAPKEPEEDTPEPVVEKQEVAAKVDNSSPVPALKTTPPDDPEQLMVGVVHSVKDVDGWVNSYYKSSDEAKRVAIYQNMDQPGHIFVLEHITKERIKEKLDVGSLNFFFKVDHQEEMDDLKRYCAAFYFEVANYEKWKSTFTSEKMKDIRASYGLSVWAHARGYTNPNMIYILYTTSDLDPVKADVKINEFKRAYQEAEVTIDPELHYLEFIVPPEN